MGAAVVDVSLYMAEVIRLPHNVACILHILHLKPAVYDRGKGIHSSCLREMLDRYTELTACMIIQHQKELEASWRKSIILPGGGLHL